MLRLTPVIMSAILSLKLWHQDVLHEPEAARNDRIEMIAEGIALTAEQATCNFSEEQVLPRYSIREDRRDPFEIINLEAGECVKIWNGTQEQLAAVLIGLGWYETKFGRRFQLGQCGPDECDAARRGNTIVHRARGIWQLQNNGVIYSEEWRDSVGLTAENVNIASYAAAKTFIGRSTDHSSGNYVGMIFSYGTGAGRVNQHHRFYSHAVARDRKIDEIERTIRSIWQDNPY